MKYVVARVKIKTLEAHFPFIFPEHVVHSIMAVSFRFGVRCPRVATGGRGF